MTQSISNCINKLATIALAMAFHQIDTIQSLVSVIDCKIRSFAGIEALHSYQTGFSLQLKPNQYVAGIANAIPFGSILKMQSPFLLAQEIGFFDYYNVKDTWPGLLARSRLAPC